MYRYFLHTVALFFLCFLNSSSIALAQIPRFADERGQEVEELQVAPLPDNPEIDTLRFPKNVDGRQIGKVGDWRGPSEFIRSHWVRLTVDGIMLGHLHAIEPDSGRLSAARFLHVELFREGRRVGQAETDSEGAFAISALTPGVYSFVGRGANGFIAFSLHLLPSLNESSGPSYIRFAQAPVAETTLEINVAVVPPTFNQVQKILKDNYRRLRRFYVPESAYQPFIKMATEAKLPGWDEDQGPEIYRGTQDLVENLTDPKRTINGSTVHGHPVFLSDDNIMYGRLCGIESSTGRPRRISRSTVYIIRNDRLVTSTDVDEQGFFEIKLRRAAVYSLIAAGEDGFGALSFQAIKRPPVAEETRHEFPSPRLKPQLANRLFRWARWQAGPLDLLPTPGGTIPADPNINPEMRQEFRPSRLELPAGVDPGWLQPSFDLGGNVNGACLCVGVTDDLAALRFLGGDNRVADAENSASDESDLGMTAPAPTLPATTMGGSTGAFSGGGVGGGRLGGLLGIGGLAGITGLALAVDDDDLISPFRPGG